MNKLPKAARRRVVVTPPAALRGQPPAVLGALRTEVKLEGFVEGTREIEVENGR